MLLWQKKSGTKKNVSQEFTSAKVLKFNVVSLWSRVVLKQRKCVIFRKRWEKSNCAIDQKGFFPDAIPSIEFVFVRELLSIFFSAKHKHEIMNKRRKLRFYYCIFTS